MLKNLWMKLSKLIGTVIQLNCVTLHTSREKIDNFLQSDDVELQFPKCNAFLRRLIYQTRSESYFDKISLETRQVDNDRILFARRLQNRAELEKIERERYQRELEEFNNFEGFSKVLKMIVKSVSNP